MIRKVIIVIAVVIIMIIIIMNRNAIKIMIIIMMIKIIVITIIKSFLITAIMIKSYDYDWILFTQRFQNKLFVIMGKRSDSV